MAEPRLHQDRRGPGRPRQVPEGVRFYQQRRKWLIYKILSAAIEQMEHRWARTSQSETTSRKKVVAWAKKFERQLTQSTYVQLIRLYQQAYGRKR